MKLKTNTEIRGIARDHMIGHYASAIGFIVIYIICSVFTDAILAAAFSGINRLGAIGLSISTFIINTFLNMFMIGLYKYFIDLNHGLKPKNSELFYAFSRNISKHLSCSFFFATIYMIIIFFPTQLFSHFTTSQGKHLMLYSFVVSVIVHFIHACITVLFLPLFFIIVDFPDKPFIECQLILMWLLNGQRGRLLRLFFSLIPMYILGLLSFGIGLLWIIPYVYSAYACFYLDLTNVKSKTAS